jgi:ABC-type multidrug transport system fused ATPase/permease subunit
MASRSRRDSRGGFPRLYAAQRRWLIWRLVLNGLAQAAVAFGVALLLRRGLAEARLGALAWPAVAGIAASGLAALALRAAEAADAERLGQDYVTRVRLRILDCIAARPLLGDGSRRWGVTMTRLISDLASLRNWVSIGVAHAVVASVTICGLLSSLVFFSPRTGAAVAAMLALSLSAAWALTPLLRGYVREARRRRGRLANNLGEKIFAFRTVRHFGRTGQELERVRSESRRLRDALVRRMRAARILRGVPELMLPLTVATVVALTALGAQGADEVAISVFLLGMIAAALGELARAWNYRLAFEEGRRRIAEVLEGPRLREPEAPRDLPGEGPVSVVLDAVCVGDLGPWSFAAAAGEVALVTGPSGSGKSVLVALAARLLDPERGELRLEGVPLASLCVDALHEAVQLVSPELPLLRGSLSDNLSYGAAADDEDWIAGVISACGLDQESRLLPDGLETRVEEGGRNLPHGLRARIALARAAAVRPRLLLVDDAAFVADPAAAAALERVVSRLGVTTLVVAPESKPPLRADHVWRLTCPGAGSRREGEERAMKNFRRIQEKTDITPILEELARQPEAWHAQPGRQRIAVQREAESIPIRGLRKTAIGERKRRDVHESRYTTLSQRFLSVVAFIEDFADEQGAALGRAKIVRLPPGAQVFPHRDRGKYYACRDRYHLVLQSPGSWMRCGGEEVTMREGELWWFDNKQEHEARNDSEHDRIHLIFDLEPLGASREDAKGA